MNKPVLPMSSLSLKLPTADRSIETYRLAASRMFPSKLEGTLNRVAFSADYPFGSMKTARAFLDKLPLTDDERARISHRNAEKLLGLS